MLRFTHRGSLVLAAAIVLAGCTPAREVVSRPQAASRQTDARPGAATAGPASHGPAVADVAASYRTLRAITAQPILVDPTLAMLCTGASQSNVEAARRRSGPHAHTAVSIFMNEAAADSFARRSTRYAVGSIIVKEKRPIAYRTSNPAGGWTRAHDGVGGMIKREPGYDPAHGDWEYFYFEDATKVESGRMTSCIHCHSRAAERDFIFGDWTHRG